MPIYSKKIIEHFKNPRNVGKIKNPSAIGEAGNLLCGDLMKLYLKIGKNKKGEEIIEDIKFETLGCFPPNEEIIINEGNWEKISSVKKGDWVLNGIGRKARVVEISIRKYKGPTLTIIPFVSPFNQFSVTPEHLILCIKRCWLKSARKSNKKCKWLRINEKELLKTRPRYILAKDLKESDYLIFTFNQKIKDHPLFTKELMKLIGYYLAEGYIVGKYNDVLAFAFDKNEENISERRNISELKSLLLGITKKRAKERLRRTAKEIYICSRKWGKFFIDICSKGAAYKKLSEEILLLPFEKQWEMIKTYLKGDGNLFKRRENDFPAYRVATASKKLAIQIQEILARGGIFSSIKKVTSNIKRNWIEGRQVFTKPLYEVSFRLKRKHKFVRSNGKYFLVPVREVKKKFYAGKVFNIQVGGRVSSYLTKGFVVHNCIVAIANTSLLTTLVKGKTIKDALKIKKDDLMKGLGQPLPPFKIHCSVLAVDALKEAIYDYYLKEKIEIPEDLEKEHQRIMKTKEELEKRYKGFQTFEKEILE
jgi:NifU-like protein involved in Fe-S cluster formation